MPKFNTSLVLKDLCEDIFIPAIRSQIETIWDDLVTRHMDEIKKEALEQLYLLARDFLVPLISERIDGMLKETIVFAITINDQRKS